MSANHTKFNVAITGLHSHIHVLCMYMYWCFTHLVWVSAQDSSFHQNQAQCTSNQPGRGERGETGKEKERVRILSILLSYRAVQDHMYLSLVSSSVEIDSTSGRPFHFCHTSLQHEIIQCELTDKLGKLTLLTAVSFFQFLIDTTSPILPIPPTCIVHVIQHISQ